MTNLRNAALFSVLVFSILSVLLFIQHELHLSEKFASLPNSKSLELRRRGKRSANNAKIEKTIKEMVAILNDLKREKEDLDAGYDEEDDQDDQDDQDDGEVEEGAGEGGSATGEEEGETEEGAEEEVSAQETADTEVVYEEANEAEGAEGAEGGGEEPQDGEDPAASEEGDASAEEGEEEEAAEEEAEEEAVDDAFEQGAVGPGVNYYENHPEVVEGEEGVEEVAEEGEEAEEGEVEVEGGEEGAEEQAQERHSPASGGKGGARDDQEPILVFEESDEKKVVIGGTVGVDDVKGTGLEVAVGDGADDDAEKEQTPPLSEAKAPAAKTAAVVTAATATVKATKAQAKETRGRLVCGGKAVDSEIIYWKNVPGDAEYESPITPHHDNHHDRYLTFEYDNGGWNNIRMGMECLVVLAHAMGRTLVVPPQQHLYLLGKTHQDKEDAKAHDEMGFEDIFETSLLTKQRGLHVIHMEDFLAKEGVTGGLHGVLPPKNSTEAWGRQLWLYLDGAADENPQWSGRYIAFPSHAGDFDLSEHKDPKMLRRLKKFGGERTPVFYDHRLQQLHHIHFPGDENHRLLQHHYAFAFFADPVMQTFYKRFVRDFLRYKDNIQCAGAQLVAMVRADAAKAVVNNPNGDFYALHIRRGDFQFKDVKISAPEIVKNLRLADGTPIIPPGSLVYLSTDDPKGICENCIARKKLCNEYKVEDRPVGCPWPTSWDAFREAGWKIRFLHDYTAKGALAGVNPNTFGMVESIVCSRAKVFAGTYFSTFTGYIHRLRGFHGLGEATYYHSKHYFDYPQMKESVGHGFSREWRAGWQTDDGGSI